MRRTYSERLDGMLATLEEGRERNPRLRWKAPDGGMALWLDVGLDSNVAAARAAAAGVQLYPESSYRLDRRAGTHLRLGYTGQTPAENRSGLRALFASLP